MAKSHLWPFLKNDLKKTGPKNRKSQKRQKHRFCRFWPKTAKMPLPKRKSLPVRGSIFEGPKNTYFWPFLRT